MTVSFLAAKTREKKNIDFAHSEKPTKKMRCHLGLSSHGNEWYI